MAYLHDALLRFSSNNTALTPSVAGLVQPNIHHFTPLVW
jgi:hypothetical protein